MNTQPLAENWSDRWTYVSFSLIGIGYLFPFSAMSQPVDYWRLISTDSNLLFYISVIFMSVTLSVLVLLVFGAKSSSISLYVWRIALGFVGQFLMLLMVPSLHFVPSLSGTLYRTVILLCTSILAIATAFLDSSVIAFSCCFPVKYQQALQLGIGLSSLIGCIYRTLTKAFFPQTDEGIIVSTLVYFYVGALTIALCLMVFFTLIQSPVANRCLNPSESVDPDQDTCDTFDDTECTEEATLLPSSSHEKVTRTLTYSEKKKMVMVTWINGLSVFTIFLTTLAVWPALITVLKPHWFPELGRSGWWPLILLNVFAIMDVIGRFMVPFRFFVSHRNIWIFSLLRTIFIPLMISSVTSTPAFMSNDIVSIFFAIVLGWTNGWLGSLSIIMMNEITDSGSEKIFVGTLASFYLNVGLVTGSLLGLLIDVFLLSK